MKLSIIFISLFISIVGYSQTYTNNYSRFNNKPFPELQLEDTAGNTINTLTLIGKTIYVDFWFTSCAPCIMEVPYSRKVQQFFAPDTNIVFLNICIENFQRKDKWKQMVKDKNITGINLFYALNRPQKVNLLREFNIMFPTYILVDTAMKVVGYDAPRPSEQGLVHWAIDQASKGKTLTSAMKAVKSKEFKQFADSVKTVTATTGVE